MSRNSYRWDTSAFWPQPSDLSFWPQFLTTRKISNPITFWSSEIILIPTNSSTALAATKKANDQWWTLHTGISIHIVKLVVELEDINRSSRSRGDINSCTMKYEMKRQYVSDVRRDLLRMFGMLVSGLCSDIFTLESSWTHHTTRNWLDTTLWNLKALLVLEVVCELWYALFAISYPGQTDMGGSDNETSGPPDGMELLMHSLAGPSIPGEIKRHKETPFSP